MKKRLKTLPPNPVFLLHHPKSSYRQETTSCRILPIRSLAHMKKTYHTPGTVFFPGFACKLEPHTTFCQQKLCIALPTNKKTHRIYIRSKTGKQIQGEIFAW